MYFVKYTGPLFDDWVIDRLAVVIVEDVPGTYCLELITGEDIRAEAEDIQVFHNQNEVLYELFKEIKELKNV